ncbi:MAG: efflux RND transporter periplasmic adaptor subunit [Gammaproteobacteria bacterium]|jgi:RND family efflux transporter MFP subunit
MKSVIKIILLCWIFSYSLSSVARTEAVEHDHAEHKEHNEEQSHAAETAHNHKENEVDSHEDHSDHADNEHEHDKHGHEEHHGEELELTREKQTMAGIAVIPLQQQTLRQEMIVPGEVKSNLYATSIMSPRITAQVTSRHVRLGQSVKKGRSMITLSSVAMAEAQGDLIIANREWQRVQKLGRQVVSEKRYLKAQIAQQQSRAKVIAYGMTPAQVQRLLEKGDLAGATGQFDLLAPQSGTVIKDDFVVGEIVEPGRVLYEITDESTFWVEARARAEDAPHISRQTQAKIRFQNSWFNGKVIQVQHVIDEETRTLPVRLEVRDPNHVLHPGQFVDVRLQLTSRVPVVAIPKAAAIRNAAGEWVAFIESKPGHYRSVDINPVRTTGEQMVVEGLKPGMRLVTQGAFFLQSEMAKSGFAIHNH